MSQRPSNVTLYQLQQLKLREKRNHKQVKAINNENRILNLEEFFKEFHYIKM